jgi:hypothetical protein
MAYTAITATEFREKNGVLVDKLADELGLVDTEMAALEARIAAIEDDTEATSQNKTPKKDTPKKGDVKGDE